MNSLTKIVTGGQTGVDRGALNAALRLGVPCGGWCPRGRRAEDGQIPKRYPLMELQSWAYADRTRRNVEDSDGTLILGFGPLEGGTGLTAAYARSVGQPILVFDIEADPKIDQALDWACAHAVEVVNVAGPRESTVPGIADWADNFMSSLLVAGVAV